jgi:hypothetical protein
MDKIYLVRYCGGSYEDFYTTTVFATTKKSTATKYVAKFNRILKRWKNHYSQYEDNRYGFGRIKKEFVDQHYHRWSSIRDISHCYCEEVAVR